MSMPTLAETRTGYHLLPRLVTNCFAAETERCAPQLQATFKCSAADFCVDEKMPFALSGEGEHLWLQIRKKDMNTRDVMQILARSVGCRLRDVGYSGLKDRHAVTSQWFSLPVTNKPGVSIALADTLKQEPVFREQCEVLDQSLHLRKLRPGSHSANEFRIVLRDCRQVPHSAGTDTQSLFNTRLSCLEQQGFPNYFGLQRFGRNASNLMEYQRLSEVSESATETGTTTNTAEARLKRGRGRGRKNESRDRSRSMALSAARSLMFNAVLASRVEDKSCHIVQAGEPVLLANSQSFFICELPDATLAERLAAGDVEISGPLWGAIKEGETALAVWHKGEAARWNQWAQTHLPSETRINNKLLHEAGLRHQRRSLFCKPQQLRWNWSDKATLTLQFTLPPGVFATVLLRELCNLEEAQTIVT